MSNRALFASGESVNVLGRILSAPVSSPSELSGLAVDGLYDGDSKPMVFGSASATCTITADLNVIGDGGFEDGLGTWETSYSGAGTSISIDTSNERTGVNCIKLTNGPSHGSYSYIWKDVYVRAGQTVYVEAYSKGSASGGITIFFPDSGYWVLPDASFSATEDYAISFAANTASYAKFSLTFETPDWNESIGNDLILMRVSIAQISETSTTIYVDDMFVSLGWNVCCLHGYRIEPGSTVTARSSTDNFSAVDTVQGTFTIKHPWPVYISLPSVCVDRYFRLQISGAGFSKNAIGELILCDAKEILKNPSWPLETTIFDSKTAGEIYGETVLFSTSAAPILAVNLSFKNIPASAYEQFRDEFANRAKGEVVVIIPDESTSSVVYGTAQELAIFENAFSGNSSLQFLISGISNSHFLL